MCGGNTNNQDGYTRQAGVAWNTETAGEQFGLWLEFSSTTET
jgi:hypothetical protein